MGCSPIENSGDGPRQSCVRSEVKSSQRDLSADGPSSDDDVAKILGVLRKIGEPAEVVADRFSETMMRSGARQKLPLHIIAGVFAACGIGMIWVGKHLTRGSRFLITLLLTWIQQLAVRIRYAVFCERGAIFRFNKDPLNQRS